MLLWRGIEFFRNERNRMHANLCIMYYDLYLLSIPLSVQFWHKKFFSNVKEELIFSNLIFLFESSVCSEINSTNFCQFMVGVI